MAPPTGEKKPEKSTLLGSMNPWGGSSGGSTSKSSKNASVGSTAEAGTSAFGAPAASGDLAGTSVGTSAGVTHMSTAADHSTSSFYGRSVKRYPPGCPPLRVQWFHAVDVPKRKAHWMGSKGRAQDEKPPAPPKKYVAFAANDSRAIETAYQKELEGFEDRGTVLPGGRGRGKSASAAEGGDLGDRGAAADNKRPGVKVAVNEDFLFDVDIEERELAPVYWLGPVYDVRRGSWFYQEGSTLRPCEENLAAQLEEGYLKAKPWLYPARERQGNTSGNVSTKGSSENLKAAPTPAATAATTASDVTLAVPSAAPAPAPPFHPETHRLFGQYMSNVATYQDKTTAWLSTDGVLSWVTSSMYERFSGGGYLSGVKVVRGYSEPKKAKDKDKDDKRPATPTGTMLSVDDAEEKRLKALKRRSAPPSTKSAEAGGDRPSWGDTTGTAASGDKDDVPATEIERRGNLLQRQLSSLMGTHEDRSREQEEEEIRLREEKEIQDDYNAQKGETQGREIEHLILVTHGIGQLLGLRMESLNFIHDVNMLRKTLKSVYSASPDLRALNAELPEGPGNCRIQVLPVCWRHLLDFPRRKDAKKQEQDLSVVSDEEDEYPSLEDITIEGMAFARSLISDLALDILLYQSSYRDQISEIVLTEANRIHRLFRERNPAFQGTVHIIGHSLGSAIMFDILCRQRDKAAASARPADALRNPLRFWPDTSASQGDDIVASPKTLDFDFDVQDFYCLGSPIGLFQMLKGRTIAARHHALKPPSATTQTMLADGNPFEYAEDPSFLSAPAASAAAAAAIGDDQVSAVTGLPSSVSSPKVGQLFNIFHPSDPISYRLEPLIAPAMKSLKPQPLPYTKKGIFGSVAPQGLTNIGAKVGQSVSGLWSSLSAGIASNLLNRSLGLTQEDVARLEQQSHGIEMTGGGGSKAPEIVNPVDGEVETLFAHFEKTRADLAKKEASNAAGDGADGDSKADKAAARRREEARVQRMRREEAKVRALNRNGRIDYSIQESVLDFNPINTIASHMAYWADEDVSHFIMAQVFSSKRPGK